MQPLVAKQPFLGCGCFGPSFVGKAYAFLSLILQLLCLVGSFLDEGLGILQAVLVPFQFQKLLELLRLHLHFFHHSLIILSGGFGESASLLGRAHSFFHVGNGQDAPFFRFLCFYQALVPSSFFIFILVLFFLFFIFTIGQGQQSLAIAPGLATFASSFVAFAGGTFPSSLAAMPNVIQQVVLSKYLKGGIS